MEGIKSSLLSFGKVELNTVLITVFLSVLVLISLIFGNNLMVFLVALILAAIFIWKSPQAGLLAALLTTMIFGEHFSLLPIQFREVVYKIYALDFVVLITFVFWLLKSPVHSITKIDWKAKKNAWLLVFLGFILLNVVRSFLMSSDLTLALGTFKNYIYALLYFLVILIVDSKEKLLRFFKVFLWGGVVLLVFVLYGMLTGSGLWSEVTPGIRYLSGLHAYYLTFSLIILLVLLVYKKYLWGYTHTLVLFLFQLAGMVGGMFRHLWLGFLTAGAVIVSWLGFKQKKNFVKLSLMIILTVIILLIGVLWATGLIGSDYNFLQDKFVQSIWGRGRTLLQRGYSVESAVGWRLETWRVALDKFLSNPAFGIGFGKKFFFEYRGFIDFVDIRNIHNDFASLLVQMGILGFLPFLLFNIYNVRDLFKVLKSRDVFYKPISLMLLGFYIIAVFGIFFAIYIMFNGTSVFYWTIMALISALVNSEKRKVKN